MTDYERQLDVERDYMRDLEDAYLDAEAAYDVACQSLEIARADVDRAIAREAEASETADQAWRDRENAKAFFLEALARQGLVRTATGFMTAEEAGEL